MKYTKLKASQLGKINEELKKLEAQLFVNYFSYEWMHLVNRVQLLNSILFINLIKLDIFNAFKLNLIVQSNILLLYPF